MHVVIPVFSNPTTGPPSAWPGTDDPSATLTCSKWDLMDMWLLPVGVASPGLDRDKNPRSSFYSWLPIFRGFPGGSDGKASAYNAGDLGLIPGWEDPLEKEMATHSSTLA
ncbi:unnamed protein product [Rangifer tarandus platyrhynchus]|uniref:Uncharacterized protein n=2 Tax=Rangifer tarandus platyrhynchus TaxID=3082113 RepID=A0AC59YV24_RANTA|nr:unnamed protein product [Rangifer tarandus platyrhynchus]